MYAICAHDLPKLTAALMVVRHCSGVTHQKVPCEAIAMEVCAGIWWSRLWKLSVSCVNMIATV